MSEASAEREARKHLLHMIDTCLEISNEDLGQFLTLARHPKTRPSYLRYLRDTPNVVMDPNPIIGDYIQDFEERQRIFSVWQRERPRNLAFTPAAIGILMVAPLHTLQAATRTVENLQDPVNRYGHLFPLFEQSTPAIRSYLPKGPKGGKKDSKKDPNESPSLPSIPTEPPLNPSPKKTRNSYTTHKRSFSDAGPTWQQQQPESPTPSSGASSGGARSDTTTETTTRDKVAAVECKNRDENVCIFSKTPDPAAAHIFPYASQGHEKTKFLQDILQIFWGKERATPLIKKMTSREFVESKRNMISMNHQLHHWFDNARFALKPIPSDQPNELWVQLHWLKRSGFPRFSTTLSQGDLLGRGGINARTAQQWGEARFSLRESGLPIQSGQVFKIKADDPNDLPDMEMMQLQWDLLRVAAIAGAGEDDDEDFWDSDEDGDIESIDLDEVDMVSDSDEYASN